MSDQNPNTNPSAVSQTVETDPEVLPSPVRHFSAHEKLAILDELAVVPPVCQATCSCV